MLPKDVGSSGWSRSKADFFFGFWNPGILQPNKKIMKPGGKWKKEGDLEEEEAEGMIWHEVFKDALDCWKNLFFFQADGLEAAVDGWLANTRDVEPRPHA